MDFFEKFCDWLYTRNINVTSEYIGVSVSGYLGKTKHWPIGYHYQ